MTIEAQVEAGDIVVTRIAATETNSGEFNEASDGESDARAGYQHGSVCRRQRCRGMGGSRHVGDDGPARSFTGLIQIGPSITGTPRTRVSRIERPALQR